MSDRSPLHSPVVGDISTLRRNDIVALQLLLEAGLGLRLISC